MKRPVEWWHMIIQTILFFLALGGMLWNYSTGQQKQKDDIEVLKYRMDALEHIRHEDALLQQADMNELKMTQKETNQKVTDILIILQNKADRLNH